MDDGDGVVTPAEATAGFQKAADILIDNWTLDHNPLYKIRPDLRAKYVRNVAETHAGLIVSEESLAAGIKALQAGDKPDAGENAVTDTPSAQSASAALPPQPPKIKEATH